MADLASVKAEIKVWERKFQEKNSRKPGPDDAKKYPDIAAKYKLYKQLSKAAQQSALPSTRNTQTTAPLSSFNPFSPSKNKGKQPESPVTARLPRPNNPFTTPSKSAPKPPIFKQSSKSPPRATTSTSAGSATLDLPKVSVPEPPSAVVRARKRLRGEPVSPSPNKDKKRRIHSTLAMTTRNSAQSSDSEDDEDMEEGKAGSSFLYDSPIKKAPPGAKSFTALFEDHAAVSSTGNKLRAALVRPKSNNAPNGLFGGLGNNEHSSISFDDDLDWEMGDDTSNRDSRTKPSKAAPMKPRTKKWAPTKDNLHETKSSEVAAVSGTSSGRTAKRTSLHEGSDEDRQEVVRSSSNSVQAVVLIPPSPPPADSSSNASRNPLLKGKAKSRKKPKVADQDREEDGDSSSSENTNMKVVRVRSFAQGSKLIAGGSAENEAAEEDESDPDPILRYFRHPKKSPGGGFTSFITPEGDEDFVDDDEDHFSEPGFDDFSARPPQSKKHKSTVEINLPDKLKHLLALSSSESHARNENLKQEMMAESLLYGRRTGHYDGSKGGEFWGAGDVDNDEEGLGSGQKKEQLEGEEDDWEGEPVPWEVGEL